MKYAFWQKSACTHSNYWKYACKMIDYDEVRSQKSEVRNFI